jgi:hypothetical protein
MALFDGFDQYASREAGDPTVLELTLDFLQAFSDTDGVGEDGGLVVVCVGGRDGVQLICDERCTLAKSPTKQLTLSNCAALRLVLRITPPSLVNKLERLRFHTCMISPISPRLACHSRNYNKLLTKLQHIIDQRLLLCRRLPLLHTERRCIPIDGRLGVERTASSRL